MKILNTSDWHLRVTSPENRIDHFQEVQMNKVKEIIGIYKQYQCDLLIINGDVFDNAKVPHALVKKYMEIFRSAWEDGVNVMAVFGQHDLRFHSKERENTPLSVVAAAGYVNVLTNDPFIASDDLHIYGSSFEEIIPKVEDPGVYNILVIHTMVIDEKLWKGQEEYQAGSIMLFKHNFDLILSGDNHQTFTLFEQGARKILVNPGSLMRAGINQVDHKPSVFIIDTELREVQQIPLTIKPFMEVMNFEKAKKEEETNKELEAFVEGLKEDIGSREFDYIGDLKNTARQTGESLVMEIMEECLIGE